MHVSARHGANTRRTGSDGVGQRQAEQEALPARGEAHDTLEEFDLAVAKYEEAEVAFDALAAEATHIGSEIAVLDKAKRAMESVKEEADKLNAKTYASVRYEQAVKLAEQVVDESDRVQAAGRYNKAAERYHLALAEAKDQGEVIVAAARKAAEPN